MNPLVDLFLDPNKKVIEALSLGEPTAMNCELCGDLSDLCDCGFRGTGGEFCVGDVMAGKWKKVNKALRQVVNVTESETESQWFQWQEAYAALASCDPGAAARCEGHCLREADAFVAEYVEHGEIIHEGFLKGLGDTGGGIVALIVSLLVVCFALFCMVKLLHGLIMGRAKAMILRATNMNDYLAMLVGGVLTFVVPRKLIGSLEYI